jgi:hypothetical protein
VLTHALDRIAGILQVRPEGPLETVDFENLAAEVDPYIEQAGGLNGLLIEAPTFPGWENLGALLRHLTFVREHHREIARVALVTDSKLGDLAERVAGHFVSAEIKHFQGDQMEAARAWLAETSG